ncbi:alpha-amylase family glycosyl hydrolase [Lignipirellula cremea]|uniref:1,4-alpha-glucan branching enzyme n=1 Tax=Lignipirellula cremea TaxID=2528010 RepID=A0A518E544_9BACT|nr:alpha-amylase family glycosyl hydrolase [Lignipirellula cremea]QDU99187.1 1,4-alpha-glucan branching enzyme GlgB [Lignipirellula cremea]
MSSVSPARPAAAIDQGAEVVSGMGANLHQNGVAFRVWAPHAQKVFVSGSFNEWSDTANPLTAEENGYWYGNVESGRAGDEYKYVIHNQDQVLWRNDPYSREVTNSVGNSLVCDPRFDWEDDDFQLPPLNELVIYEAHIGTFAGADTPGPGNFRDAQSHLEYLKNLGVNAIEIMPAAEFAGDLSWGYNPAYIFAIESAYGGPTQFKKFVKEAHRHGIGVLLDVVYNHFGPSDLGIWQFDGWSENGGGGIYFYNDWRAETPWGSTRPDYGRGEVRQYIRDNAMMWLEEYRVDGLRFDMTLYMRTVDGNGNDLPDGWGLTQWITREMRERFPHKIALAEDLRNNAWLTKAPGDGGAGFHTQWDAQFVHPVRATVSVPDDSLRSMQAVRDAICTRYNDDAFQRVVYSESHDEVANGKARVPSEVSPSDPENRYGEKRSTLAAVLVMTSPGVPMLFQGQEFLTTGWFQDTEPLDWDRAKEYGGLVQMYQDLIGLRRNLTGVTAGLKGQHVNVHHLDDNNKVIAFRRWEEGGPGDDVVVVLNFCSQKHDAYSIGFPQDGLWKLRLNSDWDGYSELFDNTASTDLTVKDGHASVKLAPYSALIYSQDKPA